MSSKPTESTGSGPGRGRWRAPLSDRWSSLARMMRLPTLRATEASGDSWDDPEPDKLASLVHDLDETNRFLILERYDGPSLWQFYMQIYRNDDGTYTLEYRAGGPDSH